MMKKIKLSLLSKYFTTVLCLFGVYVGVFYIINYFIYRNYTIPVNYIANIFCISLIVAFILELILKINRFNIYIQITLVYLLIMFSICLLGYVNNLFIFNSSFIITFIIINLVMIACILIVSQVMSYLDNRNLNDSLNSFKERDSK